MTVYKFLKTWMLSTLPPGHREGQHLFNTLYDVRPDLANALRTSDKDPFYTNDKINDALVYIVLNWDKTEQP